MTSITGDRFGGGKPKQVKQQLNKAAKEGQKEAHKKFINKLKKEHRRQIKQAKKRNRKKLLAKLKKNRMNKKDTGIFTAIFGKKFSRSLGKIGQDIEKGVKRFNKNVLKPVGSGAIDVADWTIDHTDEIASGMDSVGEILQKVGGVITVAACSPAGASVAGATAIETAGVSVAAVGTACGIAVAMTSIGTGLKETAPLVKQAGEKARKVKDIVIKIKEIKNMIEHGQDAIETMEKMADILDDAAKVNGDKEFNEAAKHIRKSIKLTKGAILHGKTMIKAIESGNIEAGIKAAKQIAKDIKEGKKLAKDVKKLVKKAKGKLSGQKQEEKEEKKKEKKKPTPKKKPSASKEKSKTLAQLRPEAKALGIKGYSTMKKADLINAINNAQNNLVIPPLPDTKPIKSTITKKKSAPKKKSKRAPSKYNLFVGRKIKEGHSFTEATVLWRTAPENPKAK